MKLSLVLVLFLSVASAGQINLPSSKVLIEPIPGNPQTGIGSFPVSAALSPDGKYLAILDAGFGAWSHKLTQGIAIVNLATDKATFYADSRLEYSKYKDANDDTQFRLHQTYFLGLAFSADGSHLYASMGSLSDPQAKQKSSTGNGIAVYRFSSGRVTQERFIFLPPQPLPSSRQRARAMKQAPEGTAVPFPAGIAVLPSRTGDQLLVACNLSDSVLEVDAASGKVLRTYDLSTSALIPSAYPYTVIANHSSTRAWVSLWNASEVAELDLRSGTVARRIPLQKPKSPTDAGSHPTAMALSSDDLRLYVALANTDEVAEIRTDTANVARILPTRLPAQSLGGAFPNALAFSSDGNRLFVANAGTNTVAVLDISRPATETSRPVSGSRDARLGFIPTEWYPTAVAVRGGDLWIVSGRSQGTGSNSVEINYPMWFNYTYIPALLQGSLAHVNIADMERNLASLTERAAKSNLLSSRSHEITFADGSRCGSQQSRETALAAKPCPIRHVIYVIKENRTYDQVFGDLGFGNGDRSLTMYGEAVTPNHHKLALQFGVLDNLYDSGEVSGVGHVWSTAATTTDYTERIWPIDYRSKERTYDFEGMNNEEYPLLRNIPDINEPGSGYLWGNAARHGITYRHYGEYVSTQWCDGNGEGAPPGEAATAPPPESCASKATNKGEPLPANVGNPRGGVSPYPWPVPTMARNLATKPELRDHFDPNYPDFRIDYPDQLRADEFLNEFSQFVRHREGGHDTLPNLIVLRLPNDHTFAKKPGYCRPAACVADNDLALGRVVEAVSHSPYWSDTAILVLEDDAQDGADHVDAHRSIAFVISKYSPRASEPRTASHEPPTTAFAKPAARNQHAFVDHTFYTTVSMVHTIEVLLGLPPMNNNDAYAQVMSPLFSGPGDQPPFTADYRNRDSGFIYQANPLHGPDAAKSSKLDFSHADAIDPAILNRILWHDAKGKQPMPAPRHTVFPASPHRDRDDDR